MGPPAGLDTKQTVGVGQRLSRCPGRASHLKWSPQVSQDSKAAAGLLGQSLRKRGVGDGVKSKPKPLLYGLQVYRATKSFSRAEITVKHPKYDLEEELLMAEGDHS